MTKLAMSANLGTSAKQVWEMIGRFNAMPDWHPAIEKSEIEEDGGVTLRRLSLAGGGELVERLEQLDDEGNATVKWSGEFDADGGTEAEMTKVVEGIYQAGLDNLKKMFGG